MTVYLLGKGLYEDGFKRICKLLGSKELHYKLLTSHKNIPLPSSANDLIISFGYERIIPEEIIFEYKNRVIVFHSSDLPNGKGWAPLYYALEQNLKELVVSMIFASKDVDSGDIIAKGKCPIHSCETIYTLRKKDDLIVLKMLEKYIQILLKADFEGTKQTGSSSWNKKRSPEDSIIDQNCSFPEIITKIKALPDEYLAFIEIDGIKIELKAIIDENLILQDKNFKIKIKDYRVFK